MADRSREGDGRDLERVDEQLRLAEQLRSRLAHILDALGEAGMERAQADWTQLIAEVEAERQAGTDPADPRLIPLIERWNALIAQFTGGDPGIRASLQKLYETEGPERASHGAMNRETMEYAKRAMDAHAAGG